MDIEHLTYDNSRGIGRPNTATKIKGFFERRRSSIKEPLIGVGSTTSSSSGQNSNRNSRTTTHCSSRTSDIDICSFLLKRHVEPTEARKQDSASETPTHSRKIPDGPTLVLPHSTSRQQTPPRGYAPSDSHTASSFTAPSTDHMLIPSLKRKPAFRNKLKQKLKDDLAELKVSANFAFESQAEPLNKRSKKVVRNDPAEHAYQARLALQREHAAVKSAIRNGRLERVLPRNMQQAHHDTIGVWLSSHHHHRGLPSQPSTSSTPSSSTSSHSRSHKSTKSSSRNIPARLGEYIGTSADILDSTRRELTSSLRKSAVRRLETPHLDPESDTDSDESFFCQGNEKKREARLGGRGTNPWEGTSSMCRLCRDHGVDGIGGLCRICKDEFRRRKSSSEDEEMKPTPPLKDVRKSRASMPQLKTAKGSTQAHLVREDLTSKRFPCAQEAALEATTPPLPHSSNNFSKDRHISSYERWQSPAIRDEYARAEKMFERWSLSYERDDYISPRTSPMIYSRSSISPISSDGLDHRSKRHREDEWVVPLLAGKSKPGKQHFLTRRDSTFYEFWDEVFKEHGADVSAK